MTDGGRRTVIAPRTRPDALVASVLQGKRHGGKQRAFHRGTRRKRPWRAYGRAVFRYSAVAAAVGSAADRRVGILLRRRAAGWTVL